MAKKATTLFIRDTGINLLVMKGRQVEKWANWPLEPGLVSQGLILDEERVAEAVRQLFKQEKVGMDKVITALSGHDSLYRIITLPDVPDAVLPEAVRREAKRTIPTPLEEVYYSYQNITSMTGERRIFLATFPRNAVDALVGTLRRAGIRPYIMDLAPLALCRIPDVPRAIIVNSRLDHLEVMVISDRLPQVIRRLSVPGEAESLEDKLPLIVEEFNRTVTFYNSGHMETPLDSTVPVFVCGDLTEAPDRWESLVGDKGNPVSLLPSPVEAPEGFDADPFMVNIGLALKELLPAKEGADFSVVNFNALPEVYLPKHFSIARVLIPVGIVIGVGLIVFGVIFIGYARAQIGELRPSVATEEGLVAQYQRDIASLKAKTGPMEATAEGLNNTVTSLERKRAETALDLTEINMLAGTKVRLSTVIHGGSSMTVSGEASSEGDIFDYARDLRKSDRFSNVWIRAITSAGTASNFELTVTK
ncbi:MAG: pilus assembly protein PilM [Dehalococcoidia bacterium]